MEDCHRWHERVRSAKGKIIYRVLQLFDKVTKLYMFLKKQSYFFNRFYEFIMSGCW